VAFALAVGADRFRRTGTMLGGESGLGRKGNGRARIGDPKFLAAANESVFVVNALENHLGGKVG